MKKDNQKRIYEVQDHETINQCLERIYKDGYTPIRRTEKPIFQEKMDSRPNNVRTSGQTNCIRGKKNGVILNPNNKMSNDKIVRYFC